LATEFGYKTIFSLLPYLDKMSTSTTSSTSSKGSTGETANLPYWCQLGESVRIRPYDYTGIISFVGTTHFSKGVMVGVTLDLPMGQFNVFKHFDINLSI